MLILILICRRKDEKRERGRKRKTEKTEIPNSRIKYAKKWGKRKILGERDRVREKEKERKGESVKPNSRNKDTRISNGLC